MVYAIFGGWFEGVGATPWLLQSEEGGHETQETKNAYVVNEGLEVIRCHVREHGWCVITLVTAHCCSGWPLVAAHAALVPVFCVGVLFCVLGVRCVCVVWCIRSC